MTWLPGAVILVMGLGALGLWYTDHVLMLVCLTYAVVLYAYFVKDLFND